jgi:mannose-6-phosphate isomerase class I
MAGYDLRPTIQVSEAQNAASGFPAIAEELLEALRKTTASRRVLAIECYPETDYEELREALIARLGPGLALFADDFAEDAGRVQERIADCVTQDRVFGVMSHYTVDQFYPAEGIAEARRRIGAATGLVVVYGTGASMLCEPDVLAYADLTRWEAQLRLRRGMPNWKCDNAGEDALRKFKRGYFFEWRMADREKARLLPRIDFLLDMNAHGRPALVDGASFRSALGEVARRPFRLVPYFDTSVWGGHWMQGRFGLDPKAPNFGWAFDGVPEENGIVLDFRGTEVEVPATDVVLAQPDALLGPKVRARFGEEFPIRFDFLDTMGGGNLSLQVHPLVGYAQEHFGIHYTQDESYYILDATEDSSVYLGVRNGVTREGLEGALRAAARGEEAFPAERLVNRIPVGKHDHVMIPAGTIHGAGAGTVVLEISATPYIFTFKLWDWGRVGLDGLPRPVHLDHGLANVQLERDTDYALAHLVDRADAPHENLSSEPGVVSERTGLHELEFIETRRHWFDERVTLHCHESANMLNLVEGRSARVTSAEGAFPPLEVSYGETFVVPASVGAYRIENTGGGRAAVVQAYVRNP